MWALDQARLNFLRSREARGLGQTRPNLIRSEMILYVIYVGLNLLPLLALCRMEKDLSIVETHLKVKVKLDRVYFMATLIERSGPQYYTI